MSVSFQQNSKHKTLMDDLLEKNPTSSQRREYLNMDGMGMLCVAVREGRPDVIRTLVLEDGVDVNKRFGIREETALIYASKENKIDEIQALCELGADVNSLTYHDDSAILWSIYNGHFEAMKLLLKWGANPFLKYRDNRDSFLWAIKKNRVEMLEYLLALYPFASMNSLEKNEQAVSTTEMERLLEKYKLQNKLSAAIWFSENSQKRRELADKNIFGLITEMYDGPKRPL